MITNIFLTAAPAGTGGFQSLILPIVLIVAFIAILFFSSRSNKKRQQELAEMRNALEPGDEVTTIGGIVGEVVSVKDETVTIETSKDRTKIRFLRSSIQSVDVRAAEKRGARAVAEGKGPVTEEVKAETVIEEDTATEEKSEN